ncbi:MAG: polar amino acid transport system substrate-binding protein [Yoonia sp.]|jgi:polar amino acid transport system substrate-binding protein
MMRIRKLLCLGIFSISTTLATSASSDTIVLMADEWCPYNCEPGSDSPGFMVEIAREALTPFGHEIEYATLNWARALHRAGLGEINGVIGAVPEEAPEFIFGPAIGTYVDVVAFRRGETINPDTISERTDLRLGAINGYVYYGVVNQYIEANVDDRSLIQYMSGEDALEKNLRKLIAGRLDMVAEVRAVLEYTLAEHEWGDQIELAVTDDASDIFIAFSPVLPSSRTYADQLTQGVAQLRKSGRFEEIMSKYGQEAN